MQDASYVGESCRCMEDRIKEHKKDVTIKNDMSDVFHYVRDTGHNFDFEKTCVEKIAYNRS